MHPFKFTLLTVHTRYSQQEPVRKLNSWCHSLFIQCMPSSFMVSCVLDSNVIKKITFHTSTRRLIPIVHSGTAISPHISIQNRERYVLISGLKRMSILAFSSHNRYSLILQISCPFEQFTGSVMACDAHHFLKMEMSRILANHTLPVNCLKFTVSIILLLSSQKVATKNDKMICNLQTLTRCGGLLEPLSLYIALFRKISLKIFHSRLRGLLSLCTALSATILPRLSIS